MLFWGKEKLLRESHGGSIVFIIVGALIILSALAAALSKIQGSGSSTEVQGNRLDRAYYAAYSGVQYFSVLDDAQREAFKAKTESERTLGVDNGKFLITNIGSDSDNWYVDIIGSTVAANTKLTNYFVKNKSFPRSEKITTPVLHDEMDGISDVQVGASKTRIATDSSLTSNDGQVKGSNSKGVVVSNDAISGKSFSFSSKYRGRVVHKFVEAYNIFYNGTIMVFLYPTSLDNTAAGIVHKGVSTISCEKGIFSDEVYTLQFWPGKSGGVVYNMFLIEGFENTSCGKTDQNCLCSGSSSWRYEEAASVTKVIKDQWQHVAITWQKVTNASTKKDELIMTFYINGKENSKVNVGVFEPRRNNADLVVGGQADDNSGSLSTFYDGLMDDLVIYNRALPAAEITGYFDGKMKIYCTGAHKKEPICK